jgi:hypothetical protein
MYRVQIIWLEIMSTFSASQELDTFEELRLINLQTNSHLVRLALYEPEVTGERLEDVM